MGAVAAVDAFDAGGRAAVARALEHAGRATGLMFSLRVGAAEGASRAYALRLHAERGAEAPDTVLLLVDPGTRRLEIVTGSRARRRLDDATCARAAEAMTAAFAAGDLAGGVVAGLGVLAERVQQPRAPRRPAQRAKDRPGESQSTLF